MINAIVVLAFVATVAGTRFFRSVAEAREIVDTPGFRSLHARPVPRGAGLVFALVFLALVAVAIALALADPTPTVAFLAGAAIAAAVGFIDDVRSLRPTVKFIVQLALAAWILWIFGGRPLFELPGVPAQLALLLSWLGLVWLMNMYNFVDGIDGLAATSAVLICIAAILALRTTAAHGNDDAVFLAAVLGSCCAGFLVFNWPKASVFMGDAGSLFLGYVLGALIARTVVTEGLSLWTWVVLFGYLGSDTTTTTTLRLFLVRRLFRQHRSHAYQNLARIWNSHLRVLVLFVVYQIVWLTPLAIWSVVDPSRAPIAALLGVAPAIAWTIRHGPLRSIA